MAERIEKVAGHTPDFVQANIDAIAALFPNVVTEVAAEEAGGGGLAFGARSTSTCCARSSLTTS